MKILCVTALLSLFAAAVPVGATSSGGDNPVAGVEKTTKANDKSTSVGDVSVPPGVAYKSATNKINDAARARVERLLTFTATPGEIEESYASPSTMIGPSLWSQLVEVMPDLAKQLSSPNVKLSVPILTPDGQGIRKMQQFDAGVARSPNGAAVFNSAMKKLLLHKGESPTTPTLRKLTESELNIYWAMIPFDIEEPIFIAETGNHKLVLHLPGSSMSAVWIDDLSDITMKSMEEIEAIESQQRRAEELTTSASPLSDIPSVYVDPTTKESLAANWKTYTPQSSTTAGLKPQGRVVLDHLRLLNPTEVVERNVAVHQIVETKEWLTTALDKLTSTSNEGYSVTIVFRFNPDEDPEIRVASDPNFSEKIQKAFPEVFSSAPLHRARKEAVEVSLQFTIKKKD